MAQLETLHPHECGLDAARLEHFSAVVQCDIEQQRYDSALVLAAVR